MLTIYATNARDNEIFELSGTRKHFFRFDSFVNGNWSGVWMVNSVKQLYKQLQQQIREYVLHIHSLHDMWFD